MTTTVLLAPAAGGKTRACINRIRTVLDKAPLATVWVVLPDRPQVSAFRRTLALSGGAIGARLGTFNDLYAELSALGGLSAPIAPEPIKLRLVRAAIDTVAKRGELEHYLSIRRRPGFVRITGDLIAELKRCRVKPPQYAKAVEARGARLKELAALYAEYQLALERLGWVDYEGLGWTAETALRNNASLASDWQFLAIDGFDSFNSTQIAIIKLLASRVKETIVTLTGEPGMPRIAHRRFARTLKVFDQVPCQIETPHSRKDRPTPLIHLEATLFTRQPTQRPASPNVTFIEAQTTALEARESLRWLKSRIVRDGLKPAECAIVAYDLSPYQIFLRQAAHEYGLPLHFASGETLVTNPAIAAVLNLLELTVRDWARRPTLDTLRSPYFDLSAFGLSTTDTSQLAEAARLGMVVKGLDQWEEALSYEASETEIDSAETTNDNSGPPKRPVGAAARLLWQRLRAFVERVTPPEKSTLTSYVRWIEDLLSDDIGLGLEARIVAEHDTAARDLSALAAFQEVLRALVLGETILGQTAAVSYSDFYAELRGIVDAATYKVSAESAEVAGSIYAANLDSARGVSYRAVALLGLSEGLFPAPLAEDPLLSDEERQALASAGLPLEPRLRSDQQTLFYEGVTRASEYLLLSRPYLTDDGEQWQESPYWTATRELFETQPRQIRPDDSQPLCEAASANELLAWAVCARALPITYQDLMPQWELLRHAGGVLRSRLAVGEHCEHEGLLSDLQPTLTARYGPKHVWSASRLETYGSCRFQFFVSSALGLEPRDPPRPGFDPAQLGSMLHEILELVYKSVVDPTDVTSVLEALPAVAQRVFAKAPRLHGFRPTPLWEVQQEELVKTLEATIRNLAIESGGFRPLRFEEPFGLRGIEPLRIQTDKGEFLFRGVIDRVDIDDRDCVRIIDYKTGASGLTPRGLIDGRRLQLALYALAAERTIGLGPAVDGFYWAIRLGKAGALHLARFEYLSPTGQAYSGVAGATQLASEHIGTFVLGVRSGNFSPAPPPGGCHDYCPAKSFCWRYTAGVR